MNWQAGKRWLWSGIGTYLVFLIVTLPAAMVTRWAAKAGIATSASNGTIWRGQALGVQAGVLNVGDIEWRIRFLPLLTGKLAADVKVTQPQGFAQTRLAIGLGGTLTMTDLSASLPLQSIVGSGGLPGGWVGMAQLHLDTLVLKQQWPVAATGTVDIVDLTGPAKSPSNIGSYRLTVPASGSDARTLVGELKDSNGAAIEVTGTLKLSTDRSYQMDVLVKARDNAPPDIIQGMQYLGSADAQGRRPFSVSGTF